MFRSRRLGRGCGNQTPRRSRGLGLAAVSLGAGIAIAAMGTGTAFGVTGCRSDPLVSLSNGMQVRLQAQISADPSQVSKVAYTLHVPRGISVTNVQFDNGALAETFNWVADKPPVGANGTASFTSQTNVTATGKATVTVYAWGVYGAVESGGSKNGNTGQAVPEDFQIQPNAGDSTCMGDVVLTGTVGGNLVVPAGVTCTVNSMSVAHNVVVQNGGTLVASNLQVAQALQVQQGASLQISGGSVSQDAQIQGLRGNSSICGVAFHHNLTLTGSTASASTTFGDPNSGCASNTVAATLQVKNNHGSFAAYGNSVSGGATCNGNMWTSVDEGGNSFQGKNSGC